MTLLAITSQKGGVGKTTCSLNLAFSFARRGRKTLLVDTDPQGAIGLSLAGRAREGRGLAECLEGNLSLLEAVIETRETDLDLLPVGHPAPARIARWVADLEDGYLLEDLLAPARERYDLVLIDTPSGLTGPTMGALRIADGILIPLQAEPLALRSVPAVLAMVAQLRQEGRGPHFAAIVLTMMQSREEASLKVAQETWQLFPPELVLEAVVPRDPVFLEASAEGVPVGLLRRRPPAVAAVFDQIAAELEERLGFTHEEGDDEAIPLVD